MPLRKPLEASGNTLNTSEAFYNPIIIAPLEPSKEGRLIYYINKATGVRRLYIPTTIVKDVLTIAHTIEGHIGFARCYERVAGL